jgi:hypothetical protein
MMDDGDSDSLTERALPVADTGTLLCVCRTTLSPERGSEYLSEVMYLEEYLVKNLVIVC